MNIFTGMGRLTRDPELKRTNSDIPVCNFSIAINRRFKNAHGEYEADFLNCTAWRGTGEFVAKYFQKGDMIAVVGSVQTRKWEDNEGKTHTATDIVVEQAHFTGSKVVENKPAFTPESQPAQGDPFPDDDTSLPFDI